MLRYTEGVARYVTRQARWVDFDNDYKTMDLSYMESVMWAFKPLWDKGLVYEGYRVMPYCWRCETPLSNFETRWTTLPAAPGPGDHRARSLLERSARPATRPLVWTTTPWTLPSNLALAVGPDIDYAVVEQGRRRALRARRGAARLRPKELGEVTTGRHAEGRRPGRGTVQPLFAFFAGGTPNAFRVLAGDFVDTEDGTGIVHMAPAFGEDDQSALRGQRHRASCAGRRARALHGGGPPTGRGPARVRGQQADHPRPQGSRARLLLSTTPTTTTTRTAGAATRR